MDNRGEEGDKEAREEGQRAFADAQALASGVASQIKMQAFLLVSAPTKREPLRVLRPSSLNNKNMTQRSSFRRWWARRDLNPHGRETNRF